MARPLDYIPPAADHRQWFHIWLLPLLWVSCILAMWSTAFGRGEAAMGPMLVGFVGMWLPIITPGMTPAGLVVMHCIGGAFVMGLIGWAHDHLGVGRRPALIYAVAPVLLCAVVPSVIWRGEIEGIVFWECIGLYPGAALLVLWGVYLRFRVSRRTA